MTVEISTCKEKLDIDFIHAFLSTEARWCLGIPRSVVEKAIANSLCFGAYLNGQQVGFARMVTDCATFGNLVDVFVVKEHQGQGVSRVILEAVNKHPDLQGLRRITLATSDKHGLYSKFGFEPLSRPGIFMEKFDAEVYQPSR
jgi:GNAT superfamily N-acetyltransferase